MPNTLILRIQISIHAPRAGSDSLYPSAPAANEISIHAPRAGSDLPAAMQHSRRAISIHAPRAGSDPAQLRHCAVLCRFQSTLPVRGATVCPEAREHVASDFNPRSPCGERREAVKGERLVCIISIHAPRAGSDWHADRPYGKCGYFNPRSPCGERRSRPACGCCRAQFQSTLPVRGATSHFLQSANQ